MRTYFRWNPETFFFEKQVEIGGRLYQLSILPEMWNGSTSKGVSRWLKALEQNPTHPITFKWGHIVSVSSEGEEEGRQDVSDMTPSRTEIATRDDEMTGHFVCSGCEKEYETRSGLWKHEQICTGCHRPPTTAVTNNVGIHIENQTININLRDLGNENPNWLTEGMLYHIVSNVNNALPIMLQKKHFNEEFPENMNLRINTKNDINQRLQVWEGGRWRLRNSKQTFYKVVIEIYDILSEALNEPCEDEEDEDDSVHPEIRKARKSERFLEKIKKIKPLWEEFREKVENFGGDENEVLRDLWEDLKTFLLDRKLCIEQDT